MSNIVTKITELREGFYNANKKYPTLLVLSPDMNFKLYKDISVMRSGYLDHNGTLFYMGMLVTVMQTEDANNQVLLFGEQHD